MMPVCDPSEAGSVCCFTNLHHRLQPWPDAPGAPARQLRSCRIISLALPELDRLSRCLGENRTGCCVLLLELPVAADRLQTS